MEAKRIRVAAAYLGTVYSFLSVFSLIILLLDAPILLLFFQPKISSGSIRVSP